MERRERGGETRERNRERLEREGKTRDREKGRDERQRGKERESRSHLRDEQRCQDLRISYVQGYLAHKETRPPRNPSQACV